jgi:hypothetical protein
VSEQVRYGSWMRRSHSSSTWRNSLGGGGWLCPFETATFPKRFFFVILSTETYHSNTWNSEDRASWYILKTKAKEMHYFSNIFW